MGQRLVRHCGHFELERELPEYLPPQMPHHQPHVEGASEDHPKRPFHHPHRGPGGGLEHLDRGVEGEYRGVAGDEETEPMLVVAGQLDEEEGVRKIQMP